MLRQITTPLVLLGASALGFVAMLSTNIGLAVEKDYWPAVRSDLRALLQMTILVSLYWIYRLVRSARRRAMAEANTVQLPAVRIVGTAVVGTSALAPPPLDPKVVELGSRIAHKIHDH